MTIWKFRKGVIALTPKADYLASRHLLPLVAESDQLIFLKALRLGVSLWDCFGFVVRYRDAKLLDRQAKEPVALYTVEQFYWEVYTK